MKTIIFAAGQGTRLRPYTDTTQKSMLLIKGKPVLEHILLYLKKFGIKDVLIATNYKEEQIMNYFKDGKNLGINIIYRHTSGGTTNSDNLINFKDLLKEDESFLVHYGDTFANINIKKLIDFHQKHPDSIVTLVGHHGLKSPHGILEVDLGGYLNKFLDKPIIPILIHCPIFVYRKTIFDHIKHPEVIETHTLPRLVSLPKKMCVYQEPNTFYYDVGTVSEYERLKDDFPLDEYFGKNN